MNIIVPSSPMRLKPDDSSELETECLFGETVEVIDEYLEWVFCKLLIDNYFGWIKKKHLGNLPTSTHRIKVKRSLLLEMNNVKSNHIHYLPLGAQICINNKRGNWAEVTLSKKHNHSIGFVPSKHIIKNNAKINDWVSTAETMIGTPYKWGGRDTLGLDCSALLQLSYQSYGINIPRNTTDQMKVKKEIIDNLKKLKRGVVVFWKGHVGIMIDKINCIHSNAYHMAVATEPLSDIISRMGKNNKIVTIKNFN